VEEFFFQITGMTKKEVEAMAVVMVLIYRCKFLSLERNKIIARLKQMLAGMLSA
jgi:hypothetical protein